MQHNDKNININSFSLPNTDRIIINIFNTNIGIDVVFKLIDDITEYLNGEMGLFNSTDFSILYDDSLCNVDRYAQFF